MRVLFVTSEVATLYKRGGLADVSYSLPVALSSRGVKIAIVMPYFESMRHIKTVCVGQMAIDFDRRRELVFIFQALLPGTKVPVYLFRHPLLNVYDGDNIVERFAFFSKAVAQLYLFAPQTLGGPYDILHCNDWHTALVPLLVGERSKVGYRERETMQSDRAKTILSIHNLLYQGETGVALTLKLGFPKTLFHSFMTPLGRAIRLLTEGFEYADVVTTVSPTYSKQIMRGYHGQRVRKIFLRRRDKILGILNGIDTELWDPKTDTALPSSYDAQTVLEKKAQIKSSLRKAVRLPEKDVPLFGFVGRLESRQKGLDLIAHAIKALPKDACQVVLLGTGEKAQVTIFERLAQKHPNIAFINSFDERLARRIYAGSDVMLVPSKFEPCGLTQMIAMRYGTLPLVRKTGGLADSVEDGVTGFVFGPYTRSALIRRMREVIEYYGTKPVEWRKMISRVMKEDFSWKHQAAHYVDLYKSLMKK